MYLLNRLLDQLIENNNNVLSIFIFSVITLVIFFVIFPRINNNNYEILDSRFCYSPENAYKVIDLKSEKFRKKYILNALTLDIIFPITYSLLFGIILTNLLKNFVSTDSLWYSSRFIPFMGGVSDVLENICISFLIIQYPMKYPIIATISSQFTSIKWIIFISSLASIIILGIRSFTL